MQKGCCGGSGGGGAGVEQQYGEGAWTGKGRRWCGSEGFRKAVQKVSVIRVSVLAGGCRPRYERGGEGMIAPAVVGCFCMDESSRGACFSCRIYDSIIESVFNLRLFLI